MSFSAAPDVKNRTPFAFEPAFLADEHGTPLFVPIIKATYDIVENGRLVPAEEQAPVNFSGTFWGDADTSSYKFEPECAFMKPATDVVLLGHAHTLGARANELSVGLQVGPVQKVVVVIGDRVWERGLAGGARMTAAQPFERMPLTYERAFGGWDRHDPNQAACDLRNPVGTGYLVRWNDRPGVALPNLEDPRNRIRSVSDRPAPAGFGFVSPHWQPRASFAGTYDAAWVSSRRPLLPRDFDRRFLNAASPGLVAPGYLVGNEPVTVVNASARGRLDFRLPGVPAPRVDITLRDAGTQIVPTHLDTVIVDTDSHRVSLIWRGHVPVTEVPRDVAAVRLDLSSS
jgi:hypothetical protein